MRPALNILRNRIAVKLANFILNTIGTPALGETVRRLIEKGMDLVEYEQFSSRDGESEERARIFDAYWNHEITAQECARRLALTPNP